MMTVNSLLIDGLRLPYQKARKEKKCLVSIAVKLS